MLSVETVPDAGRTVGGQRKTGESTGHWLRRATWRAASSCLLGGLLTWPLEWDWVRLDRLPMPLVNLGPDWEGARLAHLSDLHCGTFVREKHIHRYVEMVNALHADFVAVTGDFVTTAARRHARAVARALGDLRANRAVVACLGNHDYGRWHPRGPGTSSGIADYLSGTLADAGVIVLRNECRTFLAGESALQFVGLEDFWCPQYDPQAAFELVDGQSPLIALAHNPDAAPQLAAMGAKWILSGHTHGKATPDTRFWNTIYPTRQKQFIAGRYALGVGRYLYVNRGIGNALRVRREHRPEITLFTLRAAMQGGRRPAMPSRHVTGLAERPVKPSFQELDA